MTSSWWNTQWKHLSFQTERSRLPYIANTMSIGYRLHTCQLGDKNRFSQIHHGVHTNILYRLLFIYLFIELKWRNYFMSLAGVMPVLLVNRWCTERQQTWHGLMSPREFNSVLQNGHIWWRLQMERVSTLLALCEGNPPVTSWVPSQRSMTRSFDVFFDLRLNKRLSKQSKRQWFEVPLCLSWRHVNDFYNQYIDKCVWALLRPWKHFADTAYWLC